MNSNPDGASGKRYTGDEDKVEEWILTEELDSLIPSEKTGCLIPRGYKNISQLMK